MNEENTKNKKENESPASDKDEREEQPSLSGQQAGAANVERLRSYLERLRSSRSHLPSRNGKLDKSAIALACGFNRQTLYNNPAAIALLEGAADLLDETREETVEAGGTESIVGGKTAHLERQMDKRDRRIQTLEVRVQTLAAERDALKKELEVKDEQLRQYDIIEEVMMTNGRKFRP